MMRIGRMPASRARATASRASARGGSIMPMSPRKTSPCSAESSTRTSTPPRPSSRRRPEAAGGGEGAQRLVGERLVLARHASRRAGASATGSPPTSSWEQRGSSTSGAPLENNTRCESRSTSSCTVLISLRSDEKGSSPTRGQRVPSARSSRPALRAATISAPSVGSPCTHQRPSSCRSVALLASDAAVSVRSTPSRAFPRAAPRRRRPRPSGRSQSPEAHAPTRRHDRSHGHLVARERAGLVRGDHGGGAERLDRREPAHDGVASSHASHADREHRGDDGGQPLRHRGDGERDAEQQDFDQRAGAAHAMHQHDRGDHRDGDRHDDHAEHLADVIELALQRRVSSSLDSSKSATRPISVRIPVPTTTARPWP